MNCGMIQNKATEEIISKQETICEFPWSCALGLMFSQRKNLVMKFSKEKLVSLHNFFVFFPIDVLIVDTEMKIVEIKRNFKPFTLWRSREKGKFVVELGFSGKYEVGDQLEFG